MTDIHLIVLILIAIASATLIGFLQGYREVQILCQQVIDEVGQQYTSWKWKDYKKKFYWFTDQTNKKVSNRDSFHVSNGIAVAIISVLIALVIFFALDLMWWWLLILPAPIWIYIMQIRNFTMHTVMKK